jgi:hypothetical protein
MGAGKHQVLVLDEVHEWNMNIETLVAWAKLVLSQGSDFKVVLMSATLEAEKLSMFFDGAPIISVPGRLFPVTEQKPTTTKTATEAIALLQQGRNVLVFEAGKKEIGETIQLITSSGVSAEVLPLHGELESSDQAKAFRRYPRAKCVVSTNVAQTSVTIDDIDAVVDGGMERRVEVVDGVEGLYLKPISLADSKQRKGRAGRTKPGIYVDMCPAYDRPDFPVAEVLRSRLDQTVLRLAEAGFDMEKLDFFHQPKKSEIHEAKRALKALGDTRGIENHFTARATYSGHVKTISGTVADNRREFVETLAASDYALAVKGDANSSVRFYEALAMGRIPLFLDTACVLPLEHILNYRDFCVFVDWRDTDRIGERLLEFHRGVSPERFKEMQVQARQAYRQYLRMDSFSSQLAAQLRSRLLGAQAG